MATEIKVPVLGESISEATVTTWLKSVGDSVAADEPILELETDKVTMEVNAPASGTLTDIVADSGADVEVGALLGMIGEAAAGDADEHVHLLHAPTRTQGKASHVRRLLEWDA